MELKKVAIIGLGTLGGFLCKHMSELDSVKELIILDYDFVETKDIYRTIYDHSKVGELKVNAMKEIINDDVTVMEFNHKYVEGKTKLPKCDLVIDCRDFVCDRLGEINVRLYISGTILIIDCRKLVKNKCQYEGSYTINLSKTEINKAAFFATQIINSEHLENLMKNNLVQRLDLNLLPELMGKAIKESLDNKIDIIYELSDGSERLQCLEENIKPILYLNEKQDVNIFVGGRPEPKKFPAKLLERIIEKTERRPVKEATSHALFPKNSLRSSDDVISNLASLVKKRGGISNFIVTIKEKNGDNYVELLEETGAA